MNAKHRDPRRVTRDATEASPMTNSFFRKYCGQENIFAPQQGSHAFSNASRVTRYASRFAVTLLLLAPLAEAADLSDPTRPPMTVHKSGPARAAESSVHVTAIFTMGERRVAVLDGQIVKAGDRVGDISIHEITADGVRFSRGGRVEFARLPTQAATVRREAAGSEEGQ